MHYLSIAFLLVGVLYCALPTLAAVRPAALFCDNMVLQSEQPIPVWGTAAPGETITVTFAQQTVTTVAGADGRWRVLLQPMPADAQPRELVIAGGNTVTCANVVVGEVWLASGQSNMNMAMDGHRGPVLNAAAEIAAAHYPLLRLFQMPNVGTAKSPEDNNWQPCTPETVKLFSAVGYYYGRDLQTALHVPVGIIHASLGGSAIAVWMPPHGSMYRECIAPLIPYALRGMIWYQGETDAGRLSYAEDMRALIAGWRGAWNVGDFPCYYVQIAPAYGFAPADLPLLWEAQRAALAIPNTYMSPSSDLGVDLHPRDKRTAGARLARIALARTYHRQEGEYSAPLYQHANIEQERIRVTFTHAQGLHSSDEGALTWFAIAGEDRVFHPAAAVIDGQSVLVSSPLVPRPLAVRFGWDNHAEPNLVNGAGLPAFAFRTDDWPVATEDKPIHVPITVQRAGAVVDLIAAQPLLQAATALPLQHGGRDYGQVALAIAGDSLLLRIHVLDARVTRAHSDWQGAVTEIYLSEVGSPHIRQVVFALQSPDKGMTVGGYEKGALVASNMPGTWRILTEHDGEYTIEAAIPLAFFSIPAGAETFWFDAAVTAAPVRGQKPAFVWLYSRELAFSNNTAYAQVHVVNLPRP